MLEDALVNLKLLSQDEGLPGTHVQCAITDKGGKIWLGTDNGLAMLDGNDVYVYSSKEGLSHNNVWSLLEDSRGNLWIGTSGGGVNLFDGKTFARFSVKEGMGYNNVNSLLEDKDGKIWIGTNGGGVTVVNGKTFVTYDQLYGLTHNSVLSLTLDKKGHVWVGTNGGGVCVFDGKGFTCYSMKQGLPSDYIVSLLEDKTGRMWIGSGDQGICVLANDSLCRFDFGQGEKIRSVHNLLEDREGNIWMGTHGTGVQMYDGTNLTTYARKEGLTDDVIDCLLEDKLGNIWIGTDGGGINVLDKKKFFNYSTKDGLCSDAMRSILEDRKGNIWIGSKGAGLDVFDGKGFRHFSDKEGLRNNTVKSLMQDRHDKIWIGQEGGGVTIYDKDRMLFLNNPISKNNFAVLTMLEDQKGDIWMGTRNGGILHDDGKQFFNYLIHNARYGYQFICMAEDRQGRIWTGTRGQGIDVLMPGGLFHIGVKEGLGNDFINCLLLDHQGHMWIGTDGGGVNVFDGKGFWSYTTDQGLADNSVVQLIEDRQGVVYAGTGKGLTTFVPAGKYEGGGNYRYQILNYHKPDGLKHEDFNGPGTIPVLDKTGSLWFSIGKGITRFFPEKGSDPFSPIVYITGIELDERSTVWASASHLALFGTREQPASPHDTVWMPAGHKFLLSSRQLTDTSWLGKEGVSYSGISQPFAFPENLVLPHQHNHLHFSFTGIRFGDWTNIRYRYIMLGAENKWNPISEKPEADYRNLLPGKYTFQVAARGANGVWSKPVSFSFTVLPPWWQTWWAYLLYILSGLTMFWLVVKGRERNLIREKELLEEKVETRTSQLRDEKQKVEEQRAEAETQRAAAEHQKMLVESKNKEITDSINYARRLQLAILPPAQEIRNVWPESFLYYQPKDIVAGDFYWLSSSREITFLAAADCTGHGVPGALVSVVCSGALNRAVKEFEKTVPGEILDKVRDLVMETFAHSESEVKDGMDISLLSFNSSTRELKWAGANNPLWYIEQGELKEITATKQAIGNTDNPVAFVTHSLRLQKGDMVFLFTDGYADQFGGPKGKKFKYKQLENLLLSNNLLDLEEQSEILKKEFEKWRGDLEQVDDVCLIGIRI
jgi:ligand-binding sensor domain-containing protein/serine phosphatase RsbU (regulator of sigma subunit)